MNNLLVTPPLTPQARRVLAQRWCAFNLYHWPANTPVKQPAWWNGREAWANPKSRSARFAGRTMRLIEKAIGREDCLREWNGNVTHPKPADLLRL